MTFYSDLLATVEARIETEYAGATLAELGDQAPFNLSLAELLRLRDYLKTISLSGDVTIDNVSVTSSALPTGASTSAKQDTGNTSLSNIDGKLPNGLTISSTRLLTDGSGVTQPVSAASLPLPTGAATSANQSTANNSLSSIDGKLSAKATSAPTTSVASSATSVTLLNENSNRKFASFRNDSTAIAYIELGATATTSSVYKLAPDGFMTLDNYTGAISCIWASANGNMRISEGV